MYNKIPSMPSPPGSAFRSLPLPRANSLVALISCRASLSLTVVWSSFRKAFMSHVTGTKLSVAILVAERNLARLAWPVLVLGHVWLLANEAWSLAAAWRLWTRSQTDWATPETVFANAVGQSVRDKPPGCTVDLGKPAIIRLGRDNTYQRPVVSDAVNCLHGLHGLDPDNRICGASERARRIPRMPARDLMAVPELHYNQGPELVPYENNTEQRRQQRNKVYACAEERRRVFETR